MDKTGNEDRVNYLVTMQICFDDPKLDFDEDWCLRSLKDKGLSECEAIDLSIDAFRDGLKNHLVGGGNEVITKITDDKTFVETQIEHYNKLKALYHKLNIL